MHRPRILIADDNQPILQRVKELLEPSYDVVGTVSNGIDLINHAKRLHPELIVLDISMPGMTGIEAAHELKKLGLSARLVFLTIHDHVEFVRACLAEGALGYVTKSRLYVDLNQAIEEALSGRCFISPHVSR